MAEDLNPRSLTYFAQEHLIQRLIEQHALTVEGLEWLRLDLRSGLMAPTGLLAGSSARHALLVDTVIAEIERIDPDRGAIYRGLGGALPAAPDDLSGMS